MNMKKSAEKKSTFDIAIKTIKYLFPIAWKAHKGFFFYGVLGVVVTSFVPFVSIMFSPMIIDELMGERNVQKLALYAAVIVLTETLGSFFVSIISIVIEKYDEKYQNLFSELMSKRNRQRHQFLCVIASKTEHHTLIAGTVKIVCILFTAFKLKGFVNTHSNIG